MNQRAKNKTKSSETVFEQKTNLPLRTVDLFAGCGGLTLGLHKAGHNLLFAVEKDPMAFETFQTNFLAANASYPVKNLWPKWLDQRSHDIQAILSDPNIKERLLKFRGEIDLVCGGPPCQGFSVGGIRDGRDSRNQLPYRYIEFVELTRPPFVLLENVEGMARKFISKPGHVEIAFVEWVKSRLNELGYDAHYEILDASAFGVPQVRRRVFLFGVTKSLCEQSGLTAEDFFHSLDSIREPFRKRLGLPTNRQITVSDAIDDLDGTRHAVCPDSTKFESGTYKTAHSAYAKLLRRNLSNSEIPNSHRFSKHTQRILEFYRKIQGEKIFGRLSKAYLVASGTKKDKKVLIDPVKPASTITTHPDEFIHFRTPRNITVREMARIQSFPDDFIFKGRYTINGPRRRLDVARCSQVGNAVAPLLAEAIGYALHEFQRRLAAAVKIRKISKTPSPKIRLTH
jgi:DNA (cytosine-5)-methyltransferase 1